MNTAPVLIIDDDLDNQEFIQEAWEELGFSNQLFFYTEAKEVLRYLQEHKTPPFLIICDVNLSGMDGFELKRKIYEDRSINYKSIPFVFFSTTPTDLQIKKSYDLGSNGFFIKGNSLKETKNTLATIVKYWQESKAPE